MCACEEMVLRERQHLTSILDCLFTYISSMVLHSGNDGKIIQFGGLFCQYDFTSYFRYIFEMVRTNLRV